MSPALAQRLRDAVSQAEPSAGTPSVATPASYSESQLEHIVAPVALYPDALLAQVLVASTFPDQVSAAGSLIDRAPDMSDSELSDAINTGDWDQSVLVLLSGFPSVLSRMASQMSWTNDLGSAVTSDQSSVMAAVQTLRSEAKAEGNLTSNDAQVVDESGQTISIRPANPKVVYVPQYDPDTIYTTRDVSYAGPAPVSTGVNPIVTGALGFGAGFLVSNLLDNNGHDNGVDHGRDHWRDRGITNNYYGRTDYWQRRDVFNWNRGEFYPRAGTRTSAWTPPARHNAPDARNAADQAHRPGALPATGSSQARSNPAPDTGKAAGAARNGQQAHNEHRPPAQRPADRAAGQPAAQKATAKQPAAKQPATNQPAAKQTAARHPAAQKPAERRPAEKQPSAKQQASHQTRQPESQLPSAETCKQHPNRQGCRT